MSRLWTTPRSGLCLRRLIARPALQALGRGEKLRRAAHAAGVHPTTLYRWRQADTFLDALFQNAFAEGKTIRPERRRLAA